MTRQETIEHLAQRYVEEGLEIEEVLDVAFSHGQLKEKIANEFYPILLKYIKENVDEDEIRKALDAIDHNRCPLKMANESLYNKIDDLVCDFTYDYNLEDDWLGDWDIESVFWDLD